MSLDGWPPDPVAEADALIARGRAREAVQKLREMITRGRGGPMARLALVRALAASGQRVEAVAAARELNQLAPTWADAAVAFGRALIANSALPAGIAELQRALRIQPEHPDGNLALAEAWGDAGEVEKSELHLDRAIRAGATGDAVAARLAAMRDAKRTDAGYVRHLFDQFSSDYDSRMRERLGYRAPEILIDMALMTEGRVRKVPTLDLGCGTGLAGPVFKPAATTLTGIDLSPEMLAKAEATGVYDTLELGDVEAWPFATRRRFGRVIACDVFVYLGDLRRTFEGVKRVLKPGGMFLFTVERTDGPDDFVLQETRRWAHARAYLERLAGETGFDLRGLIDCTPRYNAGKPIPGLAAALAPL